jgi:hypothetical protein
VKAYRGSVRAGIPTHYFHSSDPSKAGQAAPMDYGRFALPSPAAFNGGLTRTFRGARDTSRVESRKIRFGTVTTFHKLPANREENSVLPGRFMLDCLHSKHEPRRVREHPRGATHRKEPCEYRDSSAPCAPIPPLSDLPRRYRRARQLTPVFRGRLEGGHARRHDHRQEARLQSLPWRPQDREVCTQPADVPLRCRPCFDNCGGAVVSVLYGRMRGERGEVTRTAK